MVEIKEDQRWKHIKSGKVYFVTSIGKLKFGGEWHQSVSYYNANHYDDTQYTRTVEDFKEKFAYFYG